jgi:CRISPR-associated protein Cas2
MFDLPTGSKKERKEASAFRNGLLDQGYEMSQFSVYLKYCSSPDRAEALEKRIKAILPSGGKVDILKITDKQFGAMKRYKAKYESKNEKKPKQLYLF